MYSPEHPDIETQWITIVGKELYLNTLVSYSPHARPGSSPQIIRCDSKEVPNVSLVAAFESLVKNDCL